MKHIPAWKPRFDIAGSEDFWKSPWHSRVASPRRESAIVKEGWAGLGEWFICSRHIAENRAGAEWLNKSQLWNKRLAHKCENGHVRAPRGFSYNAKEMKIYGKCSGCNAEIGKEARAFIILEESGI